MTWQRAPAAAAVAAVLEQIDASIRVFATPPSTLNPPAYVVGYPQTVDYDLPTFGVDVAALPVMAAAGAGEVDRVDELVMLAKDALKPETNLGGAVVSCRPRSQSTWRLLTIAGVDVLAADLVLEIRM
jgi:hypothetical protein